jgi:predicted SAM-dependent methyltransferase
MLKIHIGCGKRDFGNDWLHVDGGDFPHVESHDIWLSCIENNSVDVIYSSHMIAYFDKEEAGALLDTWFSKLKKGGILRIATPDMGVMAELYLLYGISLNSFLGPLYGKMAMNNECIYHKTCYDFKSLAGTLLKFGFKDVQRYDWRKTEHAHVDDHSRAHWPHDPEAIASGNFNNHTLISLNIEAIK